MRKRLLRQKKSKPVKWYLLAFLVLVCAVFFFSSFMEKNLKTKQVNEEIEQLKQEIEKYEQGNKELGELIKYFATDEYVEQQARLQLGLKKEGETVVVVKEITRPTIQKTESKQEILTNYQKWWRYIFYK